MKNMADGSESSGEDSFIEDCSSEDEGSPKRRRQEMESPQSHGHLESRSRDSSRRIRDSSRRSGAGVDGNELYEAIRLGIKSNQELADEWILSYNEKSDTALLELLQCFINCAGCQSEITLRVLQPIAYKNLVNELTEDGDFVGDDDNYSLSTTRVHGRKFRHNFEEFLELLFRSCQRSILMDFKLLEHLINFVKPLSVSDNRQFRHTGTLIGLKLTTAIVETAAIVEQKVNRIEEGQGDCGVKALKTNEELGKVERKFQRILEHLFNSFFETDHRYRDSAPEIRVLCVNELGLWMLNYPQTFFEAGKLKYIGWLLSDEVLPVKISCIKVLQPLYDLEEFDSDKSRTLAAFAKKFKDRIIEMARDMKSGAVHAIKLLTSIFKNVEKVLTADDCEQVYELIYAPNRATAKAAGTFLIAFLSKSNNYQGGNASLIRLLVEFLNESGHPERIPYVVDSLIDNYPMMKDWSCMTGLLLHAPANDSEEEPLDDDDLNTLIKLMLACLKQAATGEIPEARESVNEINVEADQHVLTEHFIPLMEKLLDTFAVDPENAVNLLTIPRYFNLSMQITTSMKRELEILLQKVSDIFTIQTDEKVLDACAQIFKVFRKIPSIAEEAESLKNALVDELVDNYFVCKDNYQRVMNGVNENSVEVDDVTLCLMKLACFYSCNNFDYGDRLLFESVFYFVERGREIESFPEDIVRLSITACFRILMREFYRLYNAEAPPEEEIASLKQKLSDFLNECQLMMLVGSVSLKVEAFTKTCDLLIVLGKPFADRPHLNSLVYNVTDECKTELTKFVEAFVLDPGSVFELEHRQRFLASFCKLIQRDIVGVNCGADIFKTYVSLSQDYGDIIGETLKKAAEINAVNTARTMVISLSDLFTQIKVLTGGVDRQSPAFVAIKALAKQFSHSFDTVVANVDQAVYALHCDGIGFAVTPFENPEDSTGPPPNIAFLEILCEFSCKLTANHKNDILSFLQRRFQNVEARDGREWLEYEAYGRSLTARNRSSLQ